MGGCLPLVPVSLGFLACSCLGVSASLGTLCIGVQFLCIQSTCQLSSVSGILCLTSFVFWPHPVAWGSMDEGPHPWRASCLACLHLELGLQGIFLPCVSWLQLGQISSGRRTALHPWPRPSSPTE